MTQPQNPHRPPPDPGNHLPAGTSRKPAAVPDVPRSGARPDGPLEVPQYPPYIPESQFDASQGMPRSTLDGIHGTTGDEPVRWSPSHQGELPPYWMNDYVQDKTDPNLWWPDKRP